MCTTLASTAAASFPRVGAVDSEPPPERRKSVQSEAVLEAEKDKWIASQKAGYNLGMAAVRAWVKHHWPDYVREKLLEHLEGINFWIELDKGDYGLLKREFQGSPFIGTIIQRVKAGGSQGENLNLIRWAHDNEAAWAELYPGSTEHIMQILIALDVNRTRIQCELEQRMSGG